MPATSSVAIIDFLAKLLVCAIVVQNPASVYMLHEVLDHAVMMTLPS